jgi:hypothetical protein
MKMKKLLFAAIAIASISMLAPSSGFAEPTHPNEVGLYMAPNGYGATGTFVVGAPVTVYLVLTRPEKDGVPYLTVNAFECLLSFNPIGNMFKLGEVFPPGSINVGDNQNIQDGYLEYIVGISSGYPYPVINESVVLVAITFLHLVPNVTEVTLAPPFYGGSIPGQMAYQSVEGDLRVMYSMGGSHEAPVFIFQGEAVAVETESFGSVKALYR